MNIINAFLLRLVMHPARWFHKKGIDAEKLYTILYYKLIMDDRKPGTFQKIRLGDKPGVNGTTWFTIIFSFLIGVIISSVFLFPFNPFLQMAWYFSMFIFMLTLLLIGDLTQILFDSRDTYIILPKPVDSTTITVSRFMHIGIQLSKFIIPMAFTPFVCMIFIMGIWEAIMLFVHSLICSIFCIFLINGLYILMLKLAGPEKFKSIINWFQIILMIVLYGSIQIVPRLIATKQFDESSLLNAKLAFLLPPFWFASLWQVTTQFSASPLVWAGGAAALFFTFTGLGLVVKFLAPAFAAKLSLLQAATHNMNSREKGFKNRWENLVCKYCTNQGPESMGFQLATRMYKRSRELKLAIYPAIGYLLILAAMIVLQSKSIQNALLIAPAINKLNLIAYLYLLLYVPLIIVSFLHVSPQYKASVLYRISPLKQPGLIISGAVKSAWIYFGFIPFLALGLIGFVRNGLIFLPHYLLALGLHGCVLLVITFLGMLKMPFSEPWQTGADSGNTINSLLSLVALIIASALHWFVFSNHYLVCTTAVAGIAIAYMLFYRLKRVKISVANH